MSVNGGYPDPNASAIGTNNPAGGQPPQPPPAKAPSALQDKIVTTNAPGAHASHHRPHA
jgi:hypothetical protein